MGDGTDFQDVIQKNAGASYKQFEKALDETIVQKFVPGDHERVRHSEIYDENGRLSSVVKEFSNGPKFIWKLRSRIPGPFA